MNLRKVLALIVISPVLLALFTALVWLTILTKGLLLLVFIGVMAFIWAIVELATG